MYEVKALQKKEIEILQAVHDACEKMGIGYVLMYGTLIGAVRHKGFIPWDDDIDICMTRDDYDTFVKNAMKYLPENLIIQHVSIEKECPNIYIKVRDSNTTFLHEEHLSLNINQGVFIDVFPLDKIKSGKTHTKIEYLRRKKFDTINNCYSLDYVKTIKRPLSKIVGFFTHYIITKGILHNIKRDQYIQREDNRRRNNHYKGDDCVLLSPYLTVTGPFSLFKDRQLFEFDGHSFYGPVKYDTILSSLYGNYMMLPPKDRQITHKPVLVDLEKPYTREEIE